MDKMLARLSSLLALLVAHNPAERVPSGCNVLLMHAMSSSIRSYALPRTSEGSRKLPRTVRVSYRLNGLPATTAQTAPRLGTTPAVRTRTPTVNSGPRTLGQFGAATACVTGFESVQNPSGKSAHVRIKGCAHSLYKS